MEIRRGRFAEAEAAYGKATELNATAAGPYFGLGLALLGRRQPAQALAAWEREAEPGLRQYGLALGLLALGRRSEADQALQVLESTYAATMAEAIGSVYACRNQLDRSFSWLERAYRQHDGALPGIKADPCVNNLRSDGRYAALLRKVNLPE